ncbi:MAG TPA: PilN domain-containing protein [Gammaproteobacteria bacterium]|nr:PilN domain-containing protein [Gammaproteobacteria bacterium]
MPRINLLPWREELRKERQREFYVQLAGTVVVGLMTVGYFVLLMNQFIDNQKARNEYLRSEIKLVEQRIKEIETLQETKRQLVARMQIIEQLQQARPEIVRLLDELARAVPSGVYLTEVKQSGTSLEITGIAESSARVSTFMRNIEASNSMGNPQLLVIQSKETGRQRLSEFSLKAVQTPAVPPAEESGMQGSAQK